MSTHAPRLALLVSALALWFPARAIADDPPSIPVPVYQEVLDADPTRFHFSYRSADDAVRFGWHRAGIAFYAFANAAPGTVLVYGETPTTAPHSQYFFSMRTHDEAIRAGWGVRWGAFWAYPTARAGAVPVFVETPIQSPNSRYNFSTRSAADAERDGWEQLGIAFWVPDVHAPPPPPPQPPTFPPERQVRHPQQ